MIFTTGGGIMGTPQYSTTIQPVVHIFFSHGISWDSFQFNFSMISEKNFCTQFVKISK